MKEQVERPSWMSSTEEADILERVEENISDIFRAQFKVASSTSNLKEMKEEVKRPLWMSSTEESQILERVEEGISDAFRIQFGLVSAQHSHSTPSSSWNLMDVLASKWAISGSMLAAAAALLLVFQMPNTNKLAPLKIDSGFEQVGANTGQHQQNEQNIALQIQAKPNRAGHINEGKRWKMRVGATAQLALIRSGKHRRLVKLQRGFVKVRVTPGQVKQFVVESDGYQVLVKGTIFSVEREAGWLRVEVQRGKVVLRNPKQNKVRPITKGHGIRIDLQHLTYVYYIIQSDSKQTKVDPFVRLQKLVKQDTKKAFQYAVDLASSRRFSLKFRRSMLHKIEPILFKYDKVRAFQLKMKLSLLYKGSAAEVMFYAGLKECFKNQRAKVLCAQFSQEYKKRFPHGIFSKDLRLLLNKK